MRGGGVEVSKRKSGSIVAENGRSVLSRSVLSRSVLGRWFRRNRGRPRANIAPSARWRRELKGIGFFRRTRVFGPRPNNFALISRWRCAAEANIRECYSWISLQQINSTASKARCLFKVWSRAKLCSANGGCKRDAESQIPEAKPAKRMSERPAPQAGRQIPKEGETKPERTCPGGAKAPFSRAHSRTE